MSNTAKYVKELIKPYIAVEHQIMQPISDTSLVIFIKLNVSLEDPMAVDLDQHDPVLLDPAMILEK